jgi:hypothetical protein
LSTVGADTIATFALRLACGLLACLWLVSFTEVKPRFVRVHFLTALGLASVAAFFLRDVENVALWAALIAGMVLSFAGAIVWHVEGSLGGRAAVFGASLALLAAVLLAAQQRGLRSPSWLIADELSSTALLGTATTAMLLGHSYLIAPTMSLRPLVTLLGALGVSLVARIGVAGLSLWLWTEETALRTLETDMLLLLGVRWLVGLLGPAILGWMAWETTRIRSTQSATGILYVVVILCFLGELTSQLLLAQTRFLV